MFSAESRLEALLPLAQHLHDQADGLLTAVELFSDDRALPDDHAARRWADRLRPILEAVATQCRCAGSLCSRAGEEVVTSVLEGLVRALGELVDELEQARVSTWLREVPRQPGFEGLSSARWEVVELLSTFAMLDEIAESARRRSLPSPRRKGIKATGRASAVAQVAAKVRKRKGRGG